MTSTLALYLHHITQTFFSVVVLNSYHMTNLTNSRLANQNIFFPPHQLQIYESYHRKTFRKYIDSLVKMF